MPTVLQSYSEYSNRTSSEKITLAHISTFQRLYIFELDSGSLYKKVVPHFITGVKRNDIELTQVFDTISVDDNTKFFFDPNTSTLYLNGSNTDFGDQKIIVDYRLFFSTAPIELAWNLGNNDLEVEYLPRITAVPGFKSKIGDDQKGISVTGSGTLVLENTDGYFDDIYDTLVWEQKNVEIYSFHRELEPEEAQIIYRGIITNKSFNTNKISLKVDDIFFKLDARVPLNQYTESDGVSQQFVGQYKRRIYGKLDGLLIRSIDQVGFGYPLTGTVEALSVGTQTLTGTGTLFLDECSPNDTITILDVEYTIEEVISDTELTISSSDGFETIFSGETVTNIPEYNWRKKNRTYVVADHAISEVTTTLINQVQLNRLVVADATGISEGDIIDVGANVSTVLRVSGNQITTKFNSQGISLPGATVRRRPISKVFIEGKQLLLPDLSNIDNTVNGCEITIDELAEFNITTTKSMPSFVSFDFTNGSRTITTLDDIDLTQFLKPRDWVKTSIAPDTEFYEVLAVEEKEITLRVVFNEATITDTMEYRDPIIAGDDSNVSSNVLGKTEDGTPEGHWLQTGSEIIKDLLTESDLGSFIDNAGFDAALTDAGQLMSIALPLDIEDTSQPIIKNVIDIINQTIFGSLVLTNDLRLTYNIFHVGLQSQTPRIISEDDNIRWSISSRSAKLFKTAKSFYRFLDFDNVILEKTSKAVSYTSPFITDFETSSNTDELNLYVYETRDAQELTERYVHYNSLSRSTITILGSLNLSDISMGDEVVLDFDRLYKRLGDSNTRKKVGKVIGVERNGETVKLLVSDLGNLYNICGIIADDSSTTHALADSDEKIISAYITDENGLVDTDEDTVNTNLIT